MRINILPISMFLFVLLAGFIQRKCAFNLKQISQGKYWKSGFQHQSLVLCIAKRESQETLAMAETKKDEYAENDLQILLTVLETTKKDRFACSATAARVLDIFEKLKSSDTFPTLSARQFGRIVSGAAVHGEQSWSKAWELLITCHMYGLDPNEEIIYIRTIKGLSRFGCHQQMGKVIDLAEKMLSFPLGWSFARGHMAGALLRANLPQQTIDYFETNIIGASIAADLYGYTQYTRALGDLGLAEKCLSAIDDMIIAGIEPDNFIYCNAIRAYAQSDKWELALLVLESQKKANRADVYCYGSMLNVLASCKRCDEALKLLNEMRDSGVEPNSYCYTSLIMAFGSVGRTEDAIEILHDAIDCQKNDRERKFGSLEAVFNAAITAASKARDLQSGLWILEKMRKCGLKHGTWTLNCAMTLYNECNAHFEAILLMKKMLSEGIKPDTVTYNIAFISFSLMDDLNGAMQLFKQMHSTGVPRDKQTYSTLFNLCANEKNWICASELHLGMKNDSILPNESTFMALISICKHARMSQQILYLYEEMLRLSLKVDSYVYSAVLHACVELKKWDQAILIHLEAEKHSLATDTSFGIAVAAKIVEGRVEQAAKLLQRAQKIGFLASEKNQRVIISCIQMATRMLKKEMKFIDIIACLEGLNFVGISIPPALQTLRIQSMLKLGKTEQASNTVRSILPLPVKGHNVNKLHIAAISALSHSGNWQASMNLFNQLRLDGAMPSAETTAAAISVVSQAGQDKEVLSLVGEMVKLKHFDHSAYTLAAVVSAVILAGNHDLAVKLVLKAQSPSITLSTCEVLMRSCEQRGDLQSCLEVLRLMWRASIPRNLHMYHMAMQISNDCGAPRRTLGMLDLIRTDGFAPTLATYNMCLHAACSAHDMERAKNLMEEMRHDGHNPDIISYNILLSSYEDETYMRRLFDEMRSKEILPDSVSHCAAARTLRLSGKPEEAFRLLTHELPQAGLNHTAHTYVQLIACAGEMKEWDAAIRFHDDACSAGLSNVVTYSTAINVCASSRRWTVALGLFSEMTSKGIEPNDYTHAALIKALSNGGQSPLALQHCYKVIDVSGAEVYAAGIGACIRGENMLSEGMKLMDMMRKRKFPISFPLYHPMLRLCGIKSEPSFAMQLLKMMREDGISIPSSGFGYALGSMGADWSIYINDFLSLMKASGIKIDKQVISKAVMACTSATGVSAGLNMLEKLLSITHSSEIVFPVAKEVTEVAAYSNIVSSFYIEGLYEEADAFYARAVELKLMQHWRKESIPIDETVQHAIMDLHGYSLPLAHSAVRVALHELNRKATESSQKAPKPLPDLVIICGQGRRSEGERPVLRPEVQCMLIEEFFPPLSSSTVPSNPGRIVVCATDVEGWVKYNLRAKSVLMGQLGAIIKKRIDAAMSPHSNSAQQ